MASYFCVGPKAARRRRWPQSRSSGPDRKARSCSSASRCMEMAFFSSAVISAKVRWCLVAESTGDAADPRRAHLLPEPLDQGSGKATEASDVEGLIPDHHRLPYDVEGRLRLVLRDPVFVQPLYLVELDRQPFDPRPQDLPGFAKLVPVAGDEGEARGGRRVHRLSSLFTFLPSSLFLPLFFLPYELTSRSNSARNATMIWWRRAASARAAGRCIPAASPRSLIGK